MVIDLPGVTGGAVLARASTGAVIMVAPELGPAEQAEAVTHELVHEERDRPGWSRDLPASMRPLVAREERRVRYEVARRLVDLDDLWEFCVGMADVGLGVTAADVSERFDVTVSVATVALEQLLERWERAG